MFAEFVLLCFFANLAVKNSEQECILIDVVRECLTDQILLIRQLHYMRILASNLKLFKFEACILM